VAQFLKGRRANPVYYELFGVEQCKHERRLNKFAEKESQAQQQQQQGEIQASAVKATTKIQQQYNNPPPLFSP